MKKMLLKALVFLLLLSSCVFFLPSCKKPTDCTVRITVLDTTGVPVSAAYVRLFSKLPGADLQDKTQTTDAYGKTLFVFKYEAILDIDASKNNSGNSSEVIKLLPGKTVEKKITIK